MFARFNACKILLGACLIMLEIMRVKEQTCMLLIVTWHGSRNCTKLVLKPLAPKSSLYFFPVYCFFPVNYTISVYIIYYPPFLYHVHNVICLHSNATIFDKLKWVAVVNLIWLWTANLLLKIAVQLLCTHYRIPLYIWRL